MLPYSHPFDQQTLGMVQMDLTVSRNAIVIRVAPNAVRHCFGTVQTVKFD